MKSGGGKTFCFVFLFVWSSLLTAVGLFILPKTVWADGKKIILSEMMYNSKDDVDWIEVKNIGDDNIVTSCGKDTKDECKIDKIKLNDGDGNTKHQASFESEEKIEIKKGEYFIIANDADKFKSNYEYPEGTIILKASIDLTKPRKDKEIALFLNDNNEDKVIYDGTLGAKDNKTIERDESDGIWKESYISNGTPGKKNFSGDDKPEEKPKPKEYSKNIRINEILPDPDGKDRENEFIELYNFDDKPIDLSGWFLKAAKIVGSKEESKREFVFNEEYCKTREDKCVISSSDFFVIKSGDYKFNLLNSSLEKVSLVDPNGDLVDAMTHKDGNPNASYNFDGIGWQWSNKLSPGKKNILNNPPTGELKIEKKIYKNMLAQFQVKANDLDGDKLKFTWDFGDGSSHGYKQNTTHKYKEKGTYQVSLTIKDGSEETIETFKIEVGKFPKTELKIVGVKANPKGKDTGSETIKLKNNSKKKINLKGWSVATGWKELYNHPISKKLIIKPGETKELTRKYSAFTLNNKQTKIELRRPDGSVASKIKYSKKEGIQDDETYEKTADGWEWIGAQTDAENTQNNAKDVQAIPDEILSNENTQSDVEKTIKEDKNNQEIDNVEIQTDEPAENGEVLGAETDKNIENNLDDKPKSGNFLQRIIWNTNQFVNNVINLFA